MDKTHHGARLLEELDLLQKTRSSSDAARRRDSIGFGKWKSLRFFDQIRKRRLRCVVCLHVHQIAGLPPPMDGRVVIVGWKTTGCKGEQTLAVHVSDGAATFDEIFLHYCTSNIQSILKSFTIWVSLVDAADCDLGTFHVDLSELALVENLNSMFGGKTMSFELEGIASTGALSLSVYCRMIDEGTHDPNFHVAGHKETKNKCFSCLPDLNCLRSRPPTISTRRVPSLRSDPGFITIENSIANDFPLDDDDRGFITIEKGTIRARQQRHPSDDPMNLGEESGGLEDENPCLLMELKEAFDVDRVEDDFLRMLEEKCSKARSGEANLNSSLDPSLDLNLESLVREAEKELTKAAQVWKSRVEAAIIENEEYEELTKRWRSNASSSSGFSDGCGFGSPI